MTLSIDTVAGCTAAAAADSGYVFTDLLNVMANKKMDCRLLLVFILSNVRSKIKANVNTDHNTVLEMSVD